MVEPQIVILVVAGSSPVRHPHPLSFIKRALIVLFFTIPSPFRMRNPEFVKAAFSAIAPRYVATNHVLSMGVDLLWRQRVVQLVSEWKPENLLDLATGTGDLALAILNAMPEIRLTGSDFCQPMLDIAARRGLDHLVCADAMNLPFPSASYDTVTVAFGLRNMASYPDALREMGRMLRPGAICSFWIFPCLKAC